MKLLILFLFVHVYITCSAQDIDVKKFEKNYIGNEIKNPFKRTNKICFLGVNLGIKTHSVDYKGKRRDGDYEGLITYIDGITVNQGQELADIFRKKLEAKFQELGFTIVDPNTLANNDLYLKLLDNTIKKDGKTIFFPEMGGYRTFSTDGRPVFKFPKFAGAAHARLANQEEMLVVNFSPVLEPYFINWEREFKGKGYGTIEYKNKFDFDATTRFSHFSHIFYYDLPQQIQGPDYSNITFKMSTNFDDLLYTKAEPFIVEIVKGSTENIQDLSKVRNNTSVLGLKIDYEKFKITAEKAFDNYINHLAAYVQSKKN
jgi:hypothetical protein